MSGIARVTLELAKELLGRLLPFELCFYAQRLRLTNYIGGPDRPRIQALRLPGWSGVDRLLRMVPLVEARLRHNLLHATGNFLSVHDPERVVVTLHDAMFLSFPEAHLGHTREAQRIPDFARRCRAIITCSHYSKRDIIRHLGVPAERIAVIPWGVRHKIFCPSMDPAEVRAGTDIYQGKRPYFLSVSCDIGRKNSPLLVMSYCRLLQRGGSPCDLILLWPNPPAEVHEVVARAGATGRVHFLKTASDAELVTLYRGATAMFFPSIYEGFGLPVLEAMACGCPVVTTRYASLPEVGGEAAFYVDLEEPNALENAMARLAEDEGLGADLRQRGVEWAAGFTWAACADAVVRVYTDCLVGRDVTSD
jgi:glycosyltransferase involved in cell wall biosynthesis